MTRKEKRLDFIGFLIALSEGSIPLISTKQVLDEHLFLQRRFRREMFALIHNRKSPSWE
nr:MAG TPA: hypothetical protein [Caudoviricetes sp.]